MEKIVKQRRKRGFSALGDFDESKRVAETVIDAKRDADRHKSKLLRALRLARDGMATKPPE